MAGQAGYIGGDLDYILRAFPNHHLALDAMSRLSVKEGTAKPRGAQYTVACYFDRAVRFKADDPDGAAAVREVPLRAATSAIRPRPPAGSKQARLRRTPTSSTTWASRCSRSSATTKPLKAAHQAYALGFPLDGLRKKLESVGKWQPEQR